METKRNIITIYNYTQKLYETYLGYLQNCSEYFENIEQTITDIANTRSFDLGEIKIDTYAIEEIISDMEDDILKISDFKMAINEIDCSEQEADKKLVEVANETLKNVEYYLSVINSAYKEARSIETAELAINKDYNEGRHTVDQKNNFETKLHNNANLLAIELSSLMSRIQESKEYGSLKEISRLKKESQARNNKKRR